MRHPTLALVLLAITAGLALGCEGAPSWADDPKVISQACEPMGHYADQGSLYADIRDPRIDLASVIGVAVCEHQCRGAEDEPVECICPGGLVECDRDEWRDRCSPRTGYSLIPGRIIVSCGDLYRGYRTAVVVLR